MSLHIIVGMQWGDESKGVTSDRLCHETKADYVVRWNGGPNAGHTLYVGDDPTTSQKVVLRQLPSCTFPGVLKYIIGPGCALNMITLSEDVKALEALGLEIRGKVLVDHRCPIITPEHRMRDEAENGHIKTTGRGVGPCYSDFTARSASRACDHRTELESYGVQVCDVTKWILENVDPFNDEVVAEGAQSHWLDLIHGSYPYVTSCQTVAPSFFSTLGLGAWLRDGVMEDAEIVGVAKIYETKVGNGPFISEIADSDALNEFRTIAGEFGSNTGRPRRIGYFNLDALLEAVEVNGINSLVLAKADLADAFETHLGALCVIYKNELIELDEHDPVRDLFEVIAEVCPDVYRFRVSASPYLDGSADVTEMLVEPYDPFLA